MTTIILAGLAYLIYLAAPDFYDEWKTNRAIKKRKAVVRYKNHTR
jgi:threonine/homoserine/homoserine lactone efflux protein